MNMFCFNEFSKWIVSSPALFIYVTFPLLCFQSISFVLFFNQNRALPTQQLKAG